MSNIFPEGNLQVMQNHREYANQKQTELIQHQNKLREMQDNFDQFNGDLRPLLDKFDDLKRQEMQISSILNQLNRTATK